MCVYTGLLEQKGIVRDPGNPEPPAKDVHGHHGAHGDHGAHGSAATATTTTTATTTEDKAGLVQKLKDKLHIGHKDHP